MEIDRRSFLSGPLALALLGRAGGATGAEASRRLPILPLNTNFSYWDHHWIQWLPDHPVYEAIEVAVAGAAGADRVIRVWLTERAGAKHQVYYFNDAEIARSFAQESHHAPIALSFTERAGMAQDLDLGFTDKDGAAVHWRMRFAGATPLSSRGAGLKPQNGHAARSVLLFWYINPGAVTTDARLSIGAADFAAPADRPAEHGYHAAYDSGAYSAVVAYGASEVDETLGGGFTSSFGGGRAFLHAPYEMPGRGIYACDLIAFRRRARISLTYTDGDALEAYRHIQGDHSFSIRFDMPLPAYGSNGPVGFHFLVDDHVIANGVIRAALLAFLTMQLHWEFADPPWARDAGLVTDITPHAGGYAMRVSAQG